MPFKDISGNVFGNLSAIKPIGKDKNNKTVWECICKCGSIAHVNINSLNSGNKKSCGCMKNSGLLKMVATRKESAFGMYHVRARNSWRHMIDRCTNEKNKHYKDYGGRGISVCDRWMDLRLFIEDLGDPPDGMTLDRWPNMNGNYEPGNCRWATAKQQAQNTRRNVMANYGGNILCLSEIADRIGMKKSTLYARVRSAMDEINNRIGVKKQLPIT